jgi:hypothetical protein
MPTIARNYTLQIPHDITEPVTLIDSTDPTTSTDSTDSTVQSTPLISNNPYKDLELEELFPNADLKNTLQQHYNLNSIILKLIAFVQKIHSFKDLKLEPELTALVLNIVRDEIQDKSIDQINLVIQVLQQTFNLTPNEIKIIQQQIKYIQSNKLVKGIPFSKKFIKSSSRWITKKLG